MPPQYTNIHQIDLSLAVWLVHDDYDFIPKEKWISATGLIKPLRQVILANRVSPETQQEDLSARIPMRLGHAIHDSVENAWIRGYRNALPKLGIPPSVIKKVRLNPDPKTVQKDDIPVYVERRGNRQIAGYTISGKLDMAIEGRLKDNKSTSVWSYMLGRKDNDYILQGSIYKWIHQDIITEDEMDIQFIFTDWQSVMAKSNPDYPTIRTLSYPLPMMTLEQTETWIKSKIENLEKFFNAPEEVIPHCTDEELWRSQPVWKYYSNPDAQKATKNFDNPNDANKFRAEKGKGVVVHVPGKVKACLYCRAFHACNQKNQYEFDT